MRARVACHGTALYCTPRTRTIRTDTEIGIEEIEGALKLLKPNRSGGVDSLRAEHFKYGGKHLKLWLMKIFNRFLILEDVYTTMYEGWACDPCTQKDRGKNPYKSTATGVLPFPLFYPRSLR